MVVLTDWWRVAGFLRRAIKTPQLLELSGIGSPSILSRYGIETKIDMPEVGENVQEHNTANVTFGEPCTFLIPSSPS